jgi:cobalt-zinc-cadmium efflux system protein
MSTSETALTVHLIMPDGQPDDDFLCRIANHLHDEFDIDHTTIQVETGEHPCVLSGHAAHNG